MPLFWRFNNPSILPWFPLISSFSGPSCPTSWASPRWWRSRGSTGRPPRRCCWGTSSRRGSWRFRRARTRSGYVRTSTCSISSWTARTWRSWTLWIGATTGGCSISWSSRGELWWWAEGGWLIGLLQDRRASRVSVQVIVVWLVEYPAFKNIAAVMAWLFVGAGILEMVFSRFTKIMNPYRDHELGSANNRTPPSKPTSRLPRKPLIARKSTNLQPSVPEYTCTIIFRQMNIHGNRSDARPISHTCANYHYLNIIGGHWATVPSKIGWLALHQFRDGFVERCAIGGWRESADRGVRHLAGEDLEGCFGEILSGLIRMLQVLQCCATD